MEQTREYKVRKLAEILHTEPDVAAYLVRMRPGLLVPPGGMDYYQQRVQTLAARHGVSHQQAAAMALANPSLLFSSSA
ncbi:hypothetical protein HYH03_001147 [Edaphochlamys debaryana]|uniref:Uncharacterized protein n=1 Tax=Edaphochlamys debaryana TaxID=47281 RepID=A0A836C738_9CHLO|nr:hypothetical protein HYH03_001147 [Edaphochlamys debaryana]|eukprot:KAG2501357.1 hypothetical protein HYH03_001147 [Edaphochlamys debaryana]